MIPYIIVSLWFEGRLSQEPQPLRVNTSILFLDRFRHMWYHAAGRADAKLHSYLWPVWQIRQRKKGKKNDLIKQMSEKQPYYKPSKQPKAKKKSIIKKKRLVDY